VIPFLVKVVKLWTQSKSLEDASCPSFVVFGFGDGTMV
jgi:hypothetical protein